MRTQNTLPEACSRRCKASDTLARPSLSPIVASESDERIGDEALVSEDASAGRALFAQCDHTKRGRWAGGRRRSAYAPCVIGAVEDRLATGDLRDRRRPPVESCIRPRAASRPGLAWLPMSGSGSLRPATGGGETSLAP